MFGINKNKKINIISKLFPVPKILKMPAVGINISDHSIKIMEIENKGGKKFIKKYADEEIPDGIMKNGNVIDRAGLKKALIDVKNKYRLNFIRASLPEEKAYVFKTKIPLLKNKKAIKANIEFQLEENIPISSNETIFDFHIIPPKDSRKLDHYEAVVSALPQKIVASYMEIFNSAGLIPISFEIEAESLARALIKKGDENTYMIVDYGRTRTGISIVSRGIVRYTSTLDMGGEIINNLIKRHLGANEKEAEKIKNEQGLMGGKGSENLYNILAVGISALRDEINRRIIYWHTHKEGNVDNDKIKSIILCGGNANLKGLPEHLSSSLKVPVKRGDSWTNVFSVNDRVPDISFRESLGLASVVGLAIDSFEI